jgi:putative nucleotidyltransferase with HDIG domain
MTKQTAINSNKISRAPHKEAIAGWMRRVRLWAGIALVFLASYALNLNFSIPLFLLALVAYLRFRSLAFKNYSLLNLSLLFVVNFTVGYFIAASGWHIFYIPFCAVAMLTTLLFSSLELSLLVILASAVAVASVTKNPFYIGLLFFTSGLFAGILVLGARKRMAIIRAGLIVGLLQALMVFFIDGFRFARPAWYVYIVANGIVSGFIVLGVLPIFEYLFKTVTSISLLELADFNHPILQRMILEAPGTYHHSLVVGNLSEAACGAVGANALLARIGAYYHDIGKLQKPDYFSENQNIKESRHDSLTPTMSKLVIMNHVKEGVELAGRYRLNPRIIDFIIQHHGNSLVYYFYRRALESLEEDQEIREEGFRYPGPKPSTKETAVVLLADSVEAAARALKEPTPAKIEELVHKIINNKFIDGQLDECDLTLKDLEKISALFIHILSGIYHGRITYPEGGAQS